MEVLKLIGFLKKHIIISIVGIVLLFLLIFTNTFTDRFIHLSTRNFEDYSVNIDTSTSYVLDNDLLTNEGIAETTKEFPVEKMYFDGIRLFILMDKIGCSLDMFYIENEQNPHIADAVIQMENKTLYIWDSIKDSKSGKITLVYKDNDLKKMELSLKNVITEEKEINGYFEELYLINYQKGETSFRLNFKLNTLINVSSFRIVQNNYAATGYIMNEDDKQYDIVFPMNIDTTKEFAISIYGEEGIKDTAIPIKFY